PRIGAVGSGQDHHLLLVSVEQTATTADLRGVRRLDNPTNRGHVRILIVAIRTPPRNGARARRHCEPPRAENEQCPNSRSPRRSSILAQAESPRPLPYQLLDGAGVRAVDVAVVAS